MVANKGSENIDTSNIFEEFQGNDQLEQKDIQAEKKEKKDVFDYIKILSGVFKNLVLLGLVFLVVLTSYVSIQENDTFSDNQFIAPICFLFLGDIPLPDSNGISSTCSSISSVKKTYEEQKTELERDQAAKILSLVSDLYVVENFNKSKEVIFLLTKSKDRLTALQILDAFDKLKNDYEPLEKEKIKCFDISINNDNELSVRCEAYAAGFEKKIIGYDGNHEKLVSGSSLSVAGSFMNYIDKKSKDFTMIERENQFKMEKVIGENLGYSNKTTFTFTLKYNFNTLSF